jgi:protein TonB
MIAASIFIHGLIYAAVIRDMRIPVKKNDVAEFEFLQTEPPPPPPTVEKKEELKPENVARSTRPKAIKVARVEPKPLPPPPPNTESSPSQTTDSKPPVIKIGISLGSTTTGGGMVVGVGNSLYGEADQVASDPNSIRSYSAKETRKAPYVPPSRVSTLPKLLDQPKAQYPVEAKKEGIEGQVILLLTVDETGRVTRVKIVSGPGYGLEAAAEQTAYRFRFAPATMNGETVSTEIRYVYTFMLE